MIAKLAVMLAGLLTFSLVCMGQTTKLSVSGFVSDKDSHRAIQGAAVTSVGDKANATTTDDRGLFRLELGQGVKEGDVLRIRIEKPGYVVYDEQHPATSLPLQVFLVPIRRRRTGSSASKEPPAPDKAEPLQIEDSIVGVKHEPWFYMWPPVNESTKPIPMWTSFYLPLHNRGTRSIWIDSYLASARLGGRKSWTPLTLSLPDARIVMFTNEVVTQEDGFNYNARSRPIAADGYLGGLMVFETCLSGAVDQLKFEFRDKEGATHSLRIGAYNEAFGGKLEPEAPSLVVSLGGHPLHFDQNPPQGITSPSIEEYVRKIRPYLSLSPDVYRDSIPPGQVGVLSCDKWKQPSSSIFTISSEQKLIPSHLPLVQSLNSPAFS